MAEKPTPKTQRELSSEIAINRLHYQVYKNHHQRNQIEVLQEQEKNDRVGDIKIGLYDIDDAIKYYFDEVIRPRVKDFDEDIQVPVLYGSPERWYRHNEDNTTETKKENNGAFDYV